MSVHVTIVVLNWNNAAHTLACLGSLAALACPSCDVLVVDNGSTDDSVARIQGGFPNTAILETGANLGYAGGNNVGIRHALARGADVVGILNNDVIVEPGFLDPLLAALRSVPDVGIVTPLVADRSNEDGDVWALGSSVDWGTAAVSRNHAGEPVASWRQQSPFEVDVASGAAMLVKREVFERAGLLDEAFFLYYEEVDWCLVVRRAGYRIVAVPASVVSHEVSTTLGKSSPVIDYYMTRNHFVLITRHWHSPRRQYLWMDTFVRNLVTIAAFTVKSHGGQRVPHRNARLYALRDALCGKRGAMGPDIAARCSEDTLRCSAL